jgi:hypothetical protein
MKYKPVEFSDVNNIKSFSPVLSTFLENLHTTNISVQGGGGDPDPDKKFWIENTGIIYRHMKSYSPL